MFELITYAKIQLIGNVFIHISIQNSNERTPVRPASRIYLYKSRLLNGEEEFLKSNRVRVRHIFNAEIFCGGNRIDNVYNFIKIYIPRPIAYPRTNAQVYASWLRFTFKHILEKAHT